MIGQQGYTNKDTGNWELATDKYDHRTGRWDDDTEAMPSRFGRGGDFYVPNDAPRGPRAGNKRARTFYNSSTPSADDRMAQVEENSALDYGAPAM